MRRPSLLALLLAVVHATGCRPASGAPSRDESRAPGETDQRGGAARATVAHEQTVALVEYADDAAALGDTASAHVHLRDAARVADDAPVALVVAQASDRLGDAEAESRAYERYRQLVHRAAPPTRRSTLGLVTVDDGEGSVELVGAAEGLGDGDAAPAARPEAPSEWAIEIVATRASAARASAARAVATRTAPTPPAHASATAAGTAPETMDRRGAGPDRVASAATASARAGARTGSAGRGARGSGKAKVASSRKSASAKVASSTKGASAKVASSRKSASAKGAPTKRASTKAASAKRGRRAPATVREGRPATTHAASAGVVEIAPDTVRATPIAPRRPSRWVRARDWMRRQGSSVGAAAGALAERATGTTTVEDFEAVTGQRAPARAPRPTVPLPGEDSAARSTTPRR